MTLTTFPQTISRAGVLKILCEHAHSHNVKLRLNALWALKHLVVSADNDVKKLCLEELGEGWLIQIISEDTQAVTETPLMWHGDSAWSASGFDDEATNENGDYSRFEDEDDSKMADSIGALGQKQAEGNKGDSGISLPAQARLRLAALRDLESNPAQRQRRDDIEVQEQGLEFIRNLIGHERGASSETSEMIDYLFNALGRDRIFSILAGKLRPREYSPYSRSGEQRIIPPQPEIVAAVGYILVHMAASIPRHRQQVIAQTDLLQLVVQQYNHSNREVRVALCWLVINLTWMDDTPDGSACAHRAQELKKLGFLSRVENLMNDPDLDVRERAKTAVYQMKQHGC